MSELDSIPGQGIEIRRLKYRISLAPLLFYSMIIAEDINDIGTFHAHLQSSAIADIFALIAYLVRLCTLMV
tara:strand:+ start:75 stop:287 length:213 start_codon:yes stop_codon:yes gene_type:complete